MSVEGARKICQTKDLLCPLRNAGRGKCIADQCAWWCPPVNKRDFGTCAVVLNVTKGAGIINILAHRLPFPQYDTQRLIDDGVVADPRAKK